MNNADMPAMPLNCDTDHCPHDSCQGLTKREYMAAMVMQGLLSSIGGHDVTDCKQLAHDAVLAADTLLTALEKERTA